MTIAEALSRVQSIRVAKDAAPVYHTVAAELAGWTSAEIQLATGQAAAGQADGEPGVFHVLQETSVAPDSVGLTLRRDGSGQLSAAPVRLLFPFVVHLLRDLGEEAVETVEAGRVYPAAFSWLRPTYDYFLNQEGRIQRGLDRESYVRRLAESGFTHVEVNGLAFREGLESGPAGEAYPMFYTYCPALDQFVSSRLNEGLYPADYIANNLKLLKLTASLAVDYGLTPGLLCFEPRSVPAEFFERYPMLRGARVDHPFRSFKPRYNMTIAHPRVREHYAEMVRNLMDEVPDLGFLSIWSNDSGAGFEHTQSLYVGRNGGAYLIREWKDQAEIARTAGDNALRFLRTLRDAGREANPEFRVMTRMESFYGEHDTLWSGLGDGLDVETASLVTRGWEMPYAHPRYPDSKAFVAGSVYQQDFAPDEMRLASELETRASHAHFYFGAGPNLVFAPLLGVPYPALTLRRLKRLHDSGVRHLAHLGGTHPPQLVPFNVNHEILREFQFDPHMDLGRALERIALRWTAGEAENDFGAGGSTGADLTSVLLQAWERAEEAILAFPHVTALYSTYGFVWYRLWARPLVPNIEAIPESERAYYQDFMCTTPHNPNNVDLSRDVLFQLTTAVECRSVVERIDAHVWEPLDRAIECLASASSRAADALGPANVIRDQLVRLSALRCWLRTQRSVAAWVAGVCGYMEASTDADRADCRALVDYMIAGEIENSRDLLTLLDSGVEFMATTDQGETALIHGRNLKDLLARRVELMSAHRADEPFIDPEYMERKAGRPA